MNTVNAVIVSAPNIGTDAALVYDALTGTVLHSYKGVHAAAGSLVITGEPHIVLCACRDRAQLQAWEVAHHEQLTARLCLPGKVRALAVAPTGPRTAVVAIEESLHIYSLDSGCRLGVLSRHFQPVTSVVFLPCGRYFVSGGEDGFVYLWSLASVIDNMHVVQPQRIQPLTTLGQHSDKVTSLSISRGGVRGRLVSASADNTARVYDMATRRLLYTIVCSAEVTRAAITGLGNRVAVATATGRVAVIDLMPDPPADTIRITDETSTECHTGIVNGLCFLNSGGGLVTSGDDGEVKVWAISAASASSRIHFQHSENTAAGSRAITLQRTIHQGRGAVTNLQVVALNRELLWSDGATTTSAQPLVVLNTRHPLETAVTITLRDAGDCSDDGTAAPPLQTWQAMALQSLRWTELRSEVLQADKELENNKEMLRFMLDHL